MSDLARTTFAEISVGDTAQFEVELTEELVAQFAALSGDQNPLHMDDEYAKQTPFQGRIAHGMLSASFFSRLVGMHLPGLHSVYLSQNILFRQPARIGMTVRVVGSVLQKVEAIPAIKLSTQVIDTKTATVLISGEALVKLLA